MAREVPAAAGDRADIEAGMDSQPDGGLGAERIPIQLPESQSPFANVVEFKAYSFQQLSDATDNFHDSRKLGEGSNGVVFEGSLEGMVVAVKRLPEEAGHPDVVESFINEIRSIAAINHKNILQVLGFCLEGVTPMLVCPKLHSLEKALYEDESALTWDARYRVALGVAQGLAYLHDGARIPMIHCDIKPGNVLFDNTTFHPFIGDFGLVHLLAQGSDGTLDAFQPYGTTGFMAPELRSEERRFSVKADVYSYGKLLYALVSGQRDVRNLPDYLVLRKPSFLPFIDSFLPFIEKWLETAGNLGIMLPFGNQTFLQNDYYSIRILKDVHPVVLEALKTSGRAAFEAFTVLKLVALCTQDDPELRPSMEEVVSILKRARVSHVPLVFIVMTRLSLKAGGILVWAAAFFFQLTAGLTVSVASVSFLSNRMHERIYGL